MLVSGWQIMAAVDQTNEILANYGNVSGAWLTVQPNGTQNYD